jgi:hypothetical protein
VDCRVPLLYQCAAGLGLRRAGRVGFVHLLHMIIDPLGRLANLLNLLPDGLGENRTLGAACACSPGYGVYPLLEVGHMNSVASWPPAEQEHGGWSCQAPAV